MGKISDVVKLKSGYANFVELKSAFEATQENADRMAMYRPTKAHRVAFERICRGLYQPNDKKFYLLSGSYGTGKSHLCLMTANVLSRSSGDPEIAGFYENYARLDTEKAKLLKNIRKDGQYLVAICDYHSGRHFEDVVMKAVFDACKTTGLSTGVETEFDEAERQLSEWQKKGDKGGIRNFYLDFGKALEEVVPGLTVDQLNAGLKNYDSNVLENFRSAFKEMMGGIEFHARAGNLIPILKKLVKSQAFRDRFKGLAIFFDEFGFTLEKAGYSKDVLQGFMETICKNEPNVLFVGCIHKDFKSYADRFSKDDAAVMSARITQVDLLNEGIEEIIGAIVETDKIGDIWKKEIAPKTGVFDQLVPPSKTLGLFPWIDDVNRIRKQVLEDIYGVHPMALSCLLKLSSEIGSDARSTFTFFSGDVGGEKGSYAEFIGGADVTIAGGKLNLYTVDWLFTFFRKELSQKNPELREGQRQFVNGYYASVDALRKAAEGELLGFQEDERLKVLRTILIYQLCQIPTSIENIQFGLYCLSNSEKNQVKDDLKDLVKNGAVFFRQQSKTYELAASVGEDPYDLINRFVADITLHPPDLVKAFTEEFTKQLPEFSEAKGYNLPFTEDKRFRTRFVRAKDLGDALWDEIRADYAESRNKPANSFEGTLVYVLCEDEAEINVAKEAVKTNEDENVAMAVPHAPQPFTEILLRVKACRHYLPPNEAEKLSAQAESRLRDIFENASDGFLPMLQRLFQNILDGGVACWYWQGGKVLVDKPKQPHKPADMLCEGLFKKRSLVKHPDLNFCHDEKWRVGKNNPLKQAVSVLLDAEKIMIDNGNPDNHGEKRYLEKVLLKGAGALIKTGSEGVVSYFTCETDPTKLHDDLPVFKELFSRLSNLNPGETFQVGAFLDEAKIAPYGAGGTALILSLAHVVRAYGERLLVFKDSTRMVELQLRSYDDLVAIVSDPAARLIFGVRDISEAQIALIDLVAKAVGAPPMKHGEARSLNSTFDMVKLWWSGLPSVAKIVSLYENEQQTRLNSLKVVMDGLTGSPDRFDFLLNELPAVYTDATLDENLTEIAATGIGQEFAEDVKLFNSGEQIAQRRVAEAVCELFGAKGDMIECEKVVNKWYVELNPIQRDPAKCDDEDAKHLLDRLADQPPVVFSRKIIELLPKDYGFGPLAEWTSPHFKDYTAKIKHARAEVDKARSVVKSPKVDDGVHEIHESQKMDVEIPEGAVRIVYTVDGTDPRQAENIQQTDKTLDLVTLLGNRPNVKVQMRAVDQEGNYSEATTVEIVSKERKFEIQVESDLFGEKEAKFKCPDDTEGFVAVVRSLIGYGLKKKLLSKSEANEIESLLSDLKKQDEQGAGL